MVMSPNAHYVKQDDIRPAFTMVELVFVIVILGILAAVAIPRLGASRDDAIIVKGKSQVSAIRSGITLLKSKRLLEGNVTVITTLDGAAANTESVNLFYGDVAGNILEYPIISKNGDGSWMKTANTTYTFQLSGQAIPFTYSSTTGFDCNATAVTTGTNCKLLTQ